MDLSRQRNQFNKSDGANDTLMPICLIHMMIFNSYKTFLALKLEELKQPNRTPPFQAAPPMEQLPTQQDLAELMNLVDMIEHQMETQTSLLLALRDCAGIYTVREHMTALTQDMAAMRLMLQQAGKKNARRFSLSYI